MKFNVIYESILESFEQPSLVGGLTEDIKTYYHGSLRSDLTNLSPRMERGGKELHAGLVWFSDSAEYAKIYASDFSPDGKSLGLSGKIYKREIDTSKLNLWDVSISDLNDYIERNAEGNPAVFVNRLKENGFDGVRLTDRQIDKDLLDSVGIIEHEVIGLLSDSPDIRGDLATVREAQQAPLDIFDAKDGIGQVPWNQDIDYRGFAVAMTPYEFRKLVPRGNSREKTKEYIIKSLKEGKKIGQPFLQVDWLEKENIWVVIDHEGRSRTDAIKELYGNNAIMEVHIMPRGMKARDLTPKMKNSKILSQDGELWLKGSLRKYKDQYIVDLSGKEINLKRG